MTMMVSEKSSMSSATTSWVCGLCQQTFLPLVKTSTDIYIAFSAPMFWMRLLLYLDSIRFFGAMLVVLKVMMQESLIFFALLLVVVVGFLQAFIGMDNADDDHG